jgi:hypothetical protein
MHLRSLSAAAAVVVALMIGGAATARAAVEFCPAVASVPSPIGATFGKPTMQYAYELTALSPRVVNAALVADTDKGWYSWSVSRVALTTMIRRMHQAPFPIQTYTLAATPTLMVTFPQALTIHHSWVASAQAAGDPSLVWNSKGISECDVPPFDGPADANPATHADISPLPSLLYEPAIAAPAKPPFEIASCPREFSSSTLLDETQPATEAWTNVMPSGGFQETVAIALDPAGHVIEAWIYATSGEGPWNDEVLRAARLSTYSGSISYCRHVYTRFLFMAGFLRQN